MRKVIIIRKKKLASAVMPYWIITNSSKKAFMLQHGFETDLTRHKWNGQAVSRIDICELDMIGNMIRNGETIELLMDDSECSLFACSADGSLSNEVTIGEYTTNPITVILTTKGGWRTVSYPFLIPSI